MISYFDPEIFKSRSVDTDNCNQNRDNSKIQHTWSCTACTFLNKEKDKFCFVCNSEKPQYVSKNASTNQETIKYRSNCKSNEVYTNCSSKVINCPRYITHGSKANNCQDCLEKHSKCLVCGEDLKLANKICVSCSLIYSTCKICQSIIGKFQSCGVCVSNFNLSKKQCRGEYSCPSCQFVNLTDRKKCRNCDFTIKICNICHKINKADKLDHKNKCNHCGSSLNRTCDKCHRMIEIGINNNQCGECMKNSLICRSCNNKLLIPGKICLLCRKNKYVCVNIDCGAVNIDTNKACFICDTPYKKW